MAGCASESGAALERDERIDGKEDCAVFGCLPLSRAMHSPQRGSNSHNDKGDSKQASHDFKLASQRSLVRFSSVSGSRVGGHVSTDGNGPEMKRDLSRSHRRPSVADKFYLDLASNAASSSQEAHTLKQAGSKSLWQKSKRCIVWLLPNFWICVFLIIVVIWLLLGTIVYTLLNGWSFAQGYYFACQAGLSVGFGALSEENDWSRAYTIFHVAVGASMVAGVLALFVEVALEKNVAYFDQERYLAILNMTELDKDRDGLLSLSDLQDYYRSLRKENRLSPKRVEEIFTKVGGKADNGITLDQFQEMLISQRTCWRKLKRWYRPRSARIKIFTAFIVWTCAGLMYGLWYEEWSFMRSLEFSVTALSTGGLQAPSTSTFATVFSGTFVMTGVPVFALTLGQLANIFIERYSEAKRNKLIEESITEAEFQFAQKLEDDGDTCVDYAEYLQLSLLRLGLVDSDILRRLKSKFDELDTNSDDKFDWADVMRVNGQKAAMSKDKRHEQIMEDA